MFHVSPVRNSTGRFFIPALSPNNYSNSIKGRGTKRKKEGDRNKKLKTPFGTAGIRGKLEKTAELEPFRMEWFAIEVAMRRKKDRARVRAR